MSIDFLRLYATLLTQWLKTDAAPILGDSFAPMELFQG